MKKYLRIIYGLLSITAPTIFLAMENPDNSKKLSLQVQELCDLFSVQPEETFGFLSPASSQKFLNKFNSSINTSNDCSTLRQGIFKTIQILVLTPQEEKNARKELKTLCKTMYKQLTRFTDTESTAKKYCYNVLDCLSDDEEEKNLNNSENQIHENFAKYKLINSSQNITEQNKNELDLDIQQQACIITGKALEIAKLKEQLEQAEKEYTQLTNQKSEDQKEIEVIQIAFSLLKTSASNQLLKMRKQEQELLSLAQEQHTLVTQLQQEKKQLESIPTENRIADDTNKFFNKLIELSAAHKKAMEIKIALSYVTKYLNDAKEQPGIQKTLKNIAWNLNFYNFPSSTPLKKD